MAAQLREGSLALDIELDGQAQKQLLEYLALLIKWNAAYNLTAVRDPEKMVVRHLLDSLAIAKHITGDRLIDVGTGAGLPGIPLAIMFPDREFHLLDSNGKKTRFLFQVKTTLGLDNVSVHQARVELYQDVTAFDVVLSRAFASLSDMVNGTRHLLRPGGSFLAMKGVFPEAELSALPVGCKVEEVHHIHVPALEEKRHLVQMTLC